MYESFPVKFIRPTSENTLQVNWIALETTSGNRVIQKGHVPFLARLKPNAELTLETDKQVKESMTLPAGVLHVTRTSATIIIDE